MPLFPPAEHSQGVSGQILNWQKPVQLCWLRGRVWFLPTETVIGRKSSLNSDWQQAADNWAYTCEGVNDQNGAFWHSCIVVYCSASRIFRLGKQGTWKTGKSILFKKVFPKRSCFRKRQLDQKEGENSAEGKMWDVGKISKIRKLNAGGQSVTLAGNATSFQGSWALVNAVLWESERVNMCEIIK